jgi:hypothetical protein
VKITGKTAAAFCTAFTGVCFAAALFFLPPAFAQETAAATDTPAEIPAPENPAPAQNANSAAPIANPLPPHLIQARDMAQKFAQLPPGNIPLPDHVFEQCQTLDQTLKILVSQRRLGYLADAIDSKGLVHMWFVSNTRREWAAIVVDHALNACITSQGPAWHYALEPAQPPR